MKNYLKLSLGGILVLIVFILVSYLLQIYSDSFEHLMNVGIPGMIIYVSIAIFATVVAPVSAMPLLPVAVYLWGPITAALLSIIGWTTGAVIAFLIARVYGVKLVKNFIPLEKIQYYENFIPKSQEFLGIVAMRLFLPVDILSYLLGLFSKIDVYTYTLATIIGVTPFAFVFAYIGTMPISFQIFSFIIGGIIFMIMFYFYFKKFKKNLGKNYFKDNN